MGDKTTPVLPPHRFKRALLNNVGAMPLMVQEERTAFDVHEAHLAELRARQQQLSSRFPGPSGKIRR